MPVVWHSIVIAISLNMLKVTFNTKTCKYKPNLAILMQISVHLENISKHFLTGSIRFAFQNNLPFEIYDCDVFQRTRRGCLAVYTSCTEPDLVM